MKEVPVLTVHGLIGLPFTGEEAVAWSDDLGLKESLELGVIIGEAIDTQITGEKGGVQVNGEDIHGDMVGGVITALLPDKPGPWKQGTEGPCRRGRAKEG